MNYLLNHLSFNAKNKKLIFKLQISKKMIPLIFLFKKHSVISAFNLVKCKSKRLFAVISPCYNKKLNINFYFKSFLLANYRLQITIKALKILKLRTGNSTYILSTSNGLIDHNTALTLNKTGFFLGIIHS